MLTVDAPDVGILPIVLGLAASASTFLGGVVGLRLTNRMNLVLGLTAGVVLGVALFDLAPEALSIGGNTPRAALAALAAGLVGYMIVDRSLSGSARGGVSRMHLAPAVLTLHSFVDGLAIGLAFRVSAAFGGIVTAAVIAHDLADGLNVVSLCLANDRGDDARRWLIANAAAPLAGVLAARLVHLPASALSLFLAVFAGMFLYIGACELLPRSYLLRPSVWTTAATLAGLVLMFGVVTLAGQ